MGSGASTAPTLVCSSSGDAGIVATRLIATAPAASGLVCGTPSFLCFDTGDRHEAEEIMQDAFLRMWERWDEGRFDDPSTQGEWYSR
jgi:predicted RNA polymerase sigma factor